MINHRLFLIRGESEEADVDDYCSSADVWAPNTLLKGESSRARWSPYFGRETITAPQAEAIAILMFLW